MSFKVKGRVIRILPEISGTSAKGEWKKRDFVIDDEDGQYSKNICFTLFNDKSDFANRIKVGSQVEVSFSIESREYNDKWFSNVNAFRVDVIGNQTNATAPFDSRTPIDSNNDDDGSGLPF